MKILKTHQLRLWMLLCMVFLTAAMFAQELSFLLQGKVTDEYGRPVQGALLLSENGKNSYLTGIDGIYRLTVSDGSRSVTLSAAGYRNLTIETSEAGADEEREIKLEFDPHRTGGYVDLGYFNQTRASVTGAVATVTGEELDRAPVNILSQTLSGRMAGLNVIQNLSDFTYGGDNISLNIRGYSSVNATPPMIIIDGIICPNPYYEFLSPKEIESISVLKDGSTSAVYGLHAAGGVIVINTRRGHVGKKKINVYFDQSLQQMTKRPHFVSSAEYAELRNQAGVNDGLGAFSQFSQQEIDGYRKGGADVNYPNNDWYSLFVRDFTLRQRAGVNLSGGSEKIRFFSNVGYLHQEEPFKIADEPGRKYDPTPVVHTVNFRSNIDLTLNSYLSAYMRLTGNVQWERNAGGWENRAIYPHIFSLPPTMYGPLTPVFENHPEASSQVVTHDAEGSPIYGMLNRSGYRETRETNVITQAGINVDMSFLLKGLSGGVSMAYQTFFRNQTYNIQSYERWVRSNDPSELTFVKKGGDINSSLSYWKASTFFYHLNLLGNVGYKRRFGDHSVDVMGYYFYQMQETEGYGAWMLPYKRNSMGLTALYGYKDRYFLKGDLGYSGSEQFHPDRRYTATPAVSAAWIASKESFLAGVNVLSLLKLRASYGISANDNLGDRFLYLDYIDAAGNEGLIGNPNLSAEKIKQQSYGIELGFLHAFTLSLDYYIHKSDNLLVGNTNTIPVYQGIPLNNYPRMNTGKMENRGFELELGYRKRLSQDWTVFASAWLAQNKNKMIDVHETVYSEDYLYRRRGEGYPIGQQWALLIDKSNGNGMFNSAEELAERNLNYSFGTPRVGDFIYYDLNSDGTVDEKDLTPMGYPSLPQQYYAFSGGATFKNFELNFLFQGVNRTSFIISGLGAYENDSRGVFNDIHMNAWTPERYAAGEAIDYPALSLSSSVNHTGNSYFLMNGAYLRLKNMEIACSLPVNIAQKISAEKIRIALSAQNLLTVDYMKTKYIDPEVRTMSSFQPYRVYNIGINVIF